jgi:AraC-like DNA-binding protein
VKTSIVAKPTLVLSTTSRRRTLHASALGLVEDFHLSGYCAAPSGHSPEYQVVLPYEGAVSWRVGAKTALLDSNSVLFVGAGEDYSESHLVAGVGHASIIITPRLSLLQELCRQRVPAQHSSFKSVSSTATPRAQILVHRLLHLAAAGSDPLAGDELTIALLREALAGTRRSLRTTPLRVVDQAKQFLHAIGSEPSTLDEVARAVGVSGAYLTQAFMQCDGVPLYRYQTRLRLNRALVDLPRCEDITGLALDLGFSSHAHFSNAFRAHFGIAPSIFRNRATGARRPRVSLHARERTVQRLKNDST